MFLGLRNQFPVVVVVIALAIALAQGYQVLQTVSSCIHAKVAIAALVTLGPHYAGLALALSRPRIAPVPHLRAKRIAVACRAPQLHVGEAGVALVALLTRVPRPAQALAVGAVAESALRSLGMAEAGFTAHGRVAPVAHPAAFAVPALGVAPAGDALAGGHVAGAAGAVAALAAAPQLAGIAKVSVVTHLAMVTRVALRALCANVLGVVDQLELRVQVSVVIALQLTAGREVVGVVGQGAGASPAVVRGALQGIPIKAQAATLASKRWIDFSELRVVSASPVVTRYKDNKKLSANRKSSTLHRYSWES